MRIWLRELRKGNGLTQKELGEKLGLSESGYNLIEAGERQKNLDMNIAQKLAEIFGVTLDYICEQENRIEK